MSDLSLYSNRVAMLDFYKIAYGVIDKSTRAIGLIPRRLSFFIGNFLGQLWFCFDKRHRHVALDNLTHAFGDKMTPVEIKRLARQVFRNVAQIIFEIGWSMQLPDEDFNTFFSVDGLSNLHTAQKKQKGVLLLTAHMGNWEFLPITAAMIGLQAGTIYRPLDFLPLEQFVKYIRTRFGAKVIPKRHSTRTILKSLKHEESVGILLDQSTHRGKGVFVDFFGRRTCTNKGLALLALKTGAPVIPVFQVREKLGFRANFLPEVPLIKTGDITKDVEANTLQYTRVIETFIRRYPDQWFWVHRRWKVEPDPFPI